MDIDDFSLDPGVVHLNHGSFGAVPKVVRERQGELHREFDHDPDVFYTTLLDRIAKARNEVAAFLGAEPEGTAFVANVTEGVAVALNSVPLAAGDEILVGDHAYGAVGIAARRRAELTGAKVVTVTLPGREDGDWSGEDAAEAFLGAVTPRTRLAVFDHVTSVSARLLPVERLVEGFRALGVVTIVDAAHAPGMLDVDVSGLGADFWTGNLHKWCFAPAPSGVLAVGPAWRERVEPLVVSWYQDDGFPRSVEFQGTRDYTAWLASPHGTRLLDGLGARTVRSRNAALVARGQRIVAEQVGLVPWRSDPELSMRVLRLPEGVAQTLPEAEALASELYTRHRCRAAIRPWPAAGLLRLSAQLYNQEQDYERLASALRAVLPH
ncbi:aminotransferase class V-fold PLP-dependent enzyme [Sphaerisporangium sp. TRM90804]|uniref:aminotransferase class V-fold PLP-dependent enzyme n=1 Tax=Sphaerisporangium sp. TRM90804 TaxID=3031113 RepID=UPI00244CA271|nr:aminotransferase class V-fold PLP-dependent enzyme [Sphaerisporangium sp. TRM90804]MDH2429594.1 aminotransferase class V-fold PLP-dependent enzyme [Sphaerisporangium sp. TRM90804]